MLGCLIVMGVFPLIIGVVGRGGGDDSLGIGKDDGGRVVVTTGPGGWQ